MLTKRKLENDTILEWTSRGSLLICKCMTEEESIRVQPEEPRAIASFDLDRTLICTKSGNVHAKNEVKEYLDDISYSFIARLEMVSFFCPSSAPRFAKIRT